MSTSTYSNACMNETGYTRIWAPPPLATSVGAWFWAVGTLNSRLNKKQGSAVLHWRSVTIKSTTLGNLTGSKLFLIFPVYLLKAMRKRSHGPYCASPLGGDSLGLFISGPERDSFIWPAHFSSQPIVWTYCSLGGPGLVYFISGL